MTKDEIAQNEQFILLPHCFPLLVIGYNPFNYRDFLFLTKCSKSSAADLSYKGKIMFAKEVYISLYGPLTKFMLSIFQMYPEGQSFNGHMDGMHPFVNNNDISE